MYFSMPTCTHPSDSKTCECTPSHMSAPVHLLIFTLVRAYACQYRFGYCLCPPPSQVTWAMGVWLSVLINRRLPLMHASLCKSLLAFSPRNIYIYIYAFSACFFLGYVYSPVNLFMHSNALAYQERQSWIVFIPHRAWDEPPNFPLYIKGGEGKRLGQHLLY